MDFEYKEKPINIKKTDNSDDPDLENSPIAKSTTPKNKEIKAHIPKMQSVPFTFFIFYIIHIRFSNASITGVALLRPGAKGA